MMQCNTTPNTVIPAQAGIQYYRKVADPIAEMDTRLRGYDGAGVMFHSIMSAYQVIYQYI